MFILERDSIKQIKPENGKRKEQHGQEAGGGSGAREEQL
jgi:hypothetical protein